MPTVVKTWSLFWLVCLTTSLTTAYPVQPREPETPVKYFFAGPFHIQNIYVINPLQNGSAAETAYVQKPSLDSVIPIDLLGAGSGSLFGDPTTPDDSILSVGTTSVDDRQQKPSAVNAFLVFDFGPTAKNGSASGEPTTDESESSSTNMDLDQFLKDFIASQSDGEPSAAGLETTDRDIAATESTPTPDRKDPVVVPLVHGSIEPEYSLEPADLRTLFAEASPDEPSTSTPNLKSLEETHLESFFQNASPLETGNVDLTEDDSTTEDVLDERQTSTTRPDIFETNEQKLESQSETGIDNVIDDDTNNEDDVLDERQPQTSTTETETYVTDEQTTSTPEIETDNFTDDAYNGDVPVDHHEPQMPTNYHDTAILELIDELEKINNEAEMAGNDYESDNYL